MDESPAIHELLTQIGKRIRDARRQQSLSQTQLARQAGINQGFLSQIERGKQQPSTQTLNALSVALGVPPAVLIGDGDIHDAPQLLDTRDLPVFGSIPAGPPSQSQAQLEMFPVLRHLWGPDRYCLKLEFDSMEPTLKPGDIVLVHYRPDVNPEHVQGRICACLVDGQATLKRVSVERRNGDKLIVLRGDNPEVPPIIVDPVQQEFSIQGVAVCLVSRNL
ncbi:MAG: helix-turn-helix domain-containing protein [Phycisphaerae bacterium]|nr:helix-turn-helix domain-containing protein [Phycisphaerae bacterium]